MRGSVPPSRIVISSESEKSFSFAVKKRGEERDHWKHRTPCSAGCRYMKGLSRIPFHPAAGANLRPFGAPPSIGRRERPRKPLPLEGAAERSEAGLASFFAAKPPPLCLPHWGRGTASAVDRVLSYIVDLRRSPSLSFIPLEPYPARFARHLPHAGKALFQV